MKRTKRGFIPPATMMSIAMAVVCLNPLPSAASYVNHFSDGSMTWHLEANGVSGTYYSDPNNHPSTTSVVFPGAMPSDGPTIYYNMTLTGFSRSSGNNSVQIVVPQNISWDSNGSAGVRTGPLQYISARAFRNVSGFETVTIPHSILGISLPCFLNCPDLTSIKVCYNGIRELSTPADAQSFHSSYLTKDGVLYNADMTRLIKYPEGKTDRFFVVPATVTELAPYCFANTKLVAVQFQGDCPTVDETSFSGSSLVIYHEPGAQGWPTPNAGESSMLGYLNGAYTLPLSSSGTQSWNAFSWNGVGVVDGVAWFYQVNDGRATVIYVPDELDIASLQIPESLAGVPVTGIRSGFSQPHAVVSVTIPASITEIGWAPFGGDSSSDNLAEICVASENSEFYDVDGVLFSVDGTLLVCPCQKAGTYSIPAGTVAVWANAFNGCDLLTSIHIPESTTDIGVYSLGLPRGCLQFSVDPMNPVYSSINGCLFSKDGTSLLRVPGGLNGAYAIPERVVSIGEEAFSHCFDLTSITIPDSVTSIGAGAFSYTSLTSVTIPDGVTDIGHSAFYYADLTSVAIPDSVKRIGVYAFSGCPMTSIRIPYALKDEYSTWGLPDNCEIVIGAKLPLAIATEATLPVALTEADYWQPLEATGGEEPYTWEIVDRDEWPSWLSTDYIDYWDDWDYERPYLSGWPDDEDIGTHSFTLRVTDAEGTSVEKTFSLEVQENPNQPPKIDSSSPDVGVIRIEPGQSQTFSVVAHDPKGDPIFFYWYVYAPDGERLYRSESGGEASEFSWTFDAAVTGRYEVSVEVADGSHSEYCGWSVVVGYPRTLHVDIASTTDVQDGTSWETAYPTLAQAAVEAGDGDTVLVAPGVYAEDVWFQPGVTLRSRDGAAAAVLDGEGVRQCVQYYNGNSDAGFTVVGFTLRNGSNAGYSRPAVVYEGTRLENCLIENCIGTSWRGVLYDCDLVNCVVTGNESDGGIVTACRLWNCTVAENSLHGWDAAVVETCSAWNCILWNNADDSGYDNTFYASYGGWDETQGRYTSLWMPALTNCCVAGLETQAAYLASELFDVDFAAQGCFEADPKFVDASNGDFRLRTGSPCLDAGAAEFVRGETDAAGNPRMQGTAVDLGALEGAMDGFVVSVHVVGAGTVSPMSALVSAGGSATFTMTESAGRPFRGWSAGGANAGSAATYTWSDVQADCELVATFDAFSFRVDAATGDDANDGLSWKSPMATIQSAVDAAADGESVLVKPGVYGPFHAGDKAIRIESSGGKAVTIVDGGGTNRCAYLGPSAGKGATLAGFTLRNGNADWHASPKAGYGGGAYGGTLLDCDVTGCEAYEEGGGIAYAEAHRCRIVGNGIFDGDSYAYGGGAADGTLYSCLVASNVVSLALGTQDTSATALGGGTAWCSLFQCTIVDNTVEIVGDTTGVDLTIRAGGTLYGSNAGNIVFGNTAGGASSDVETWNGPQDAPGSLVGVDPLFVDRANGDYRLREDSPAVDVGATDVEEWRDPATTDTDLDGNPRVRGRGIDLGCYESAWSAERTATVTTPDPVPYVWLDGYRLDLHEGYEAAAFRTASNEVNKVWECYVAGLDPTNQASRLLATVEMEDGVPVVRWTPDLNEGGAKAERVYTVEGKEALSDPDWGPTNAASRFFRVKVEMP